ncbi:MAG: phosphate acyltransferase PlsX [Dehalococcoidia bacterium]|nr:phosphate acyltransferase PlsX [Dehalococcoidia bacterium]|tara:strand:+ start:2361 stop:3347 length:987 start_codon:yes stop_codon:yes gene_type:complete
MKIAVDAMGGDAPVNNIDGAIKALNETEIEILLVGEPRELEKLLHDKDYNKDKLSVIPSEGAILDTEQPAMAVKRKPNASINVCSGLVKKGIANGFISSGNSGATFASSAGILGMFEGLSKPCVGGPIFGFSPETLILDLGLNVDPTPKQLIDFAALGISQSKILYNIENPTVGLLSNGSESNKGNKLVKESFELFEKSSLNFFGNVEGHDIATGKVNVIVCDGFTGNIILKAIEGIGHVINQYIQENITDNKHEKIINSISKNTNIMREFGGGPVIGVNGIAIVAHGASSPTAVYNGIKTISWLSKKDYINQLKKELEEVRGSVNNE